MLTQVCLLALVIFVSDVAGVPLSIRPKQTVGVYGRTVCGEGRPVKDAKLELWDYDTCQSMNLPNPNATPHGISVTPNDLMNSSKPDWNGYFRFQGSANEFTTITPLLKITTSCGVNDGSCKRVLPFAIPKNYVTKGDSVKEWYKIGSVDLTVQVAGEKKVC